MSLLILIFIKCKMNLLNSAIKNNYLYQLSFMIFDVIRQPPVFNLFFVERCFCDFVELVAQVRSSVLFHAKSSFRSLTSSSSSRHAGLGSLFVRRKNQRKGAENDNLGPLLRPWLSPLPLYALGTALQPGSFAKIAYQAISLRSALHHFRFFPRT